MNRLAFAACAGLLAASLPAQQPADITGVIRKGGEITPLKFWVTGGDWATGEVVRNDLRLSGYFVPAAPSAAPAPPANFAGPALEKWLAGWRAQGIEALVRVERAGEEPLAVEYTLYDCAKGQIVRGQRFTGDAKQPRWVAHSISDAVVETLWGVQGIARSHLLAVREAGKAREITWLDYDGQGESAVTANGAVNLRPASARGGKLIAYISYSKVFPEVRAIEEGKTRTLFTMNDGLVSSPAFSPDGNTVYFTASLHANPDIFSLPTGAPPGSAPVRLTNSPAIDTEPAVSPDGATIAFVSDRAGGVPKIFLMNADGSNVRSPGIPLAKQTSPAFSPDGRWLLFTGSTGGGYEVFLYGLEDKSLKALTAGWGGEEPAWAPDSRHFVFVSRRAGGQQIYLATVDGVLAPEPITRGAARYLPVFVR